MSRYEDLCKKYDVWRTNALDIRRTLMFLPQQVARQLEMYLNSPDEFSIPGDDEKTRYVSLATATWNEGSNNFDLKVSKRQILDVNLHKDGHFYFALAIYLESAPNSYPKDPFWILLSAVFNEEEQRIYLKLQYPGTEFDLRVVDDAHNADQMTMVCEAIYKQIEASLEKSPFSIRSYK